MQSLVEKLDKEGILYRVSDTVNWKYELGEIARTSRRPVLFERIDKYPNFTVLCNVLSTPGSFNAALGNDGTRAADVVRFISRRKRKRIAPTFIRADWERDYSENSVNLYNLPVPWWHPDDAGRYIGTWHVNITGRPETGTRNVGVYRMQILDRNHTTLSVSPHSHLNHHMQEAEMRGEPLPMGVGIGVPEPLVIAAAASLDENDDEAEFAGALMNTPVHLTFGKTVDCVVPGTAEIILEGRIVPGERVTDGPFMDYAGVPDSNPHAYVYEVTRIAHNDRAIFRGTSVGLPGAEDHMLFSALARVGLTDFHGSRLRHLVQTFCFRRELFSLLQLSGRFSQGLHKIRGAS